MSKSHLGVKGLDFLAINSLKYIIESDDLFRMCMYFPNVSNIVHWKNYCESVNMFKLKGGGLIA